MRRTTAISLTFLAFTLVGCDTAPPLVLDAAHADYFGTWEHVSNEYGNNIVSDNMLLVFHPDSTVSYKRCINRMNGYSYTQLPGSHLEKLTDRELWISAGLWRLRWTKEFAIDRAPYAIDDQMYLEVDGVRLRKLKYGESSSHETWKCDSDDSSDD